MSCCSGVFIGDFEHVSHLFLLFLFLTLSKYFQASTKQMPFRFTTEQSPVTPCEKRKRKKYILVVNPLVPGVH